MKQSIYGWILMQRRLEHYSAKAPADVSRRVERLIDKIERPVNANLLLGKSVNDSINISLTPMQRQLADSATLLVQREAGLS